VKIDADRICEGQVVNGELRSGTERRAAKLKKLSEEDARVTGGTTTPGEGQEVLRQAATSSNAAGVCLLSGSLM
jgi:hypothetical protein